MSKITIPLTLAAVATLTACGTFIEPVRVTPVASAVVVPQPIYYGSPYYYTSPVVVAPGNVIVSSAGLRAGFGRVESVATLFDPRGTDTGMQRLSLRMDDGSSQIVDTRNAPKVSVGERVEITSDAFIRLNVASR